MKNKPECFVLYGEWGKRIYDDICTSIPPKTPLWTEKDKDEFENAFSVIADDLKKELEQVEYDFE